MRLNGDCMNVIQPLFTLDWKSGLTISSKLFLLLNRSPHEERQHHHPSHSLAPQHHLSCHCYCFSCSTVQSQRHTPSCPHCHYQPTNKLPVCQQWHPTPATTDSHPCTCTKGWNGTHQQPLFSWVKGTFHKEDLLSLPEDISLSSSSHPPPALPALPLYCSISLPSFRRHPCWVSHSILVGLKLLQQAPHSRIQQCQS